jgi:t-SNARE complex subunit (syntaxin)
VAIVFASQVNGKYGSGDFQGAISSAKQAKIWGWISMGLVILAFVLNLLYLLFALVFGMAELNAYEDSYTPAASEYDDYDPYDY